LVPSAKGYYADATIINTRSSAKHKKKKRDPDMHQTGKAKQWYVGMKAYIGVGSKTELMPTACSPNVP
jgi:IS5 family transposase